MPERREIKKIALSRPQDHNLPFSTWSLSKLAEFLVAEGVVDDISHEGLRVLLREEGVSFQVIKTWKQSSDPDFEAKKNRVLHLYDIADGKAEPAKRETPRSSSAWTSSDRSACCPGRASSGPPGHPERIDQPASPTPAPATGHLHPAQRGPHLLAAYDLNQDKMYGHIKTTKDRPGSSSSVAISAPSTRQRSASPS